MSYKKVDHAEESREWVAAAKRAGLSMEETSAFAAIAQVHATLALVEEQRASNEITRAIKEQNDGFAQQVAEVTEIARSGWENYNRLAQHISESES